MVKDCRNAEYWIAFDGGILKVFCVCSNTDKNYNQNTFWNCHGVSYLEKHLSCKSKWFLYYFKLQTLLKCKLGKWRSWRLAEHWWFIYSDVPPCWALLKLILWGCLAQFSCIKREVPHGKDEATGMCVCCSLWKCHLYQPQQLAVSLPSAFKLQINECVNEPTCYSKGTKSSLLFDDCKCRSKCAEKLPGAVPERRGDKRKWLG